MTKPVLSYDIPMGGNGTWAHTGGYSIWSLTDIAAAPLDLWERRDDCAVSLPPTPYVLHNIAAGIPHRLAHVFGFWRTSSIDTIFLKNTEGTKINYTFTLATGSPLYRSDRIAWYCDGCQKMLYGASFETKRFGLDAFWEWALIEARTFNGRAGARTCSSCGTVHQLAYGMSAAGDTPEEKDARQIW
jgi:hypothetical protein